MEPGQWYLWGLSVCQVEDIPTLLLSACQALRTGDGALAWTPPSLHPSLPLPWRTARDTNSIRAPWWTLPNSISFTALSEHLLHTCY